MEHVSGQALRVHAYQRRCGSHGSHDQGHRFFYVGRAIRTALAPKPIDAELAPAGREVGGGNLSYFVFTHLSIIAVRRRHQAFMDTDAGRSIFSEFFGRHLRTLAASDVPACCPGIPFVRGDRRAECSEMGRALQIVARIGFSVCVSLRTFLFRLAERATQSRGDWSCPVYWESCYRPQFLSVADLRTLFFRSARLRASWRACRSPRP